MDQFGQNQFAPGVSSAQFIPDQLISGPLQVVTDSVMIAKGAQYRRGTVLGCVTETQRYTLCVATATDGSEKPSAILVDDVDATGAEQNGGVYLMGEFNHNRLVFDSSWTIPALKIALRPLAIFLRDSVQTATS